MQESVEASKAEPTAEVLQPNTKESTWQKVLAPEVVPAPSSSSCDWTRCLAPDGSNYYYYNSVAHSLFIRVCFYM